MKLGIEDILIVNTVIFILIALVHAFRLVLQIPLTAGSFGVPLWISAAAVVVAGFLAWQNWNAIKGKTNKTILEVIAGLFIADIVFVVGFWTYGIEFFGFKGDLWLLTMVFDLVIIALLWWYVRKK